MLRLAVLFAWRNSPTLKRDPLAKSFFKSLSLPSLFTILGAPLPLYEASLGTKPTELFLTDEQCARLRESLAVSMGPTRAAASWAQNANHARDKLSGLRRRTFANAWDVEARMGELQLAEDAASTLPAYQELVRLRSIVSAMRTKGKGSFLACDVETWELVGFLSCFDAIAR